MPGRTARWTSASLAAAVPSGPTAIMAGGLDPSRRSSMRSHNTGWVAAQSCPHSASASQWSTSVYEPGWPSVPKLAASAAAAAAAPQRVSPSMCGVPIPALPMTARV